MKRALLLVLLAVMIGCQNRIDPADLGEPAFRSSDRVSKTKRLYGKEVKPVWTGKCVAVVDGDIIKVLNDENEQIKIRLESIDAPELGQPFGEQAKEYLAGLVLEKQVEVYETGKDRDGRTLAFVVGPESVSSLGNLMIHYGYAWNYQEYSEAIEYRIGQDEARAAKRGLWAGTGPDDQVPPWDWRKR